MVEKNQMKKIIDKIIIFFTMNTNLYCFGIQSLETKIDIEESDIPAPAYFIPDKRRIFVNIKYLNKFLSDIIKDEKDLIIFLTFIIYHELAHVVLLHDKRINKRDHYIWNIATDYVINTTISRILIDKVEISNKKFDINDILNIVKKQFLYDDKYYLKTEEEVYKELIKDIKNDKYKKIHEDENMIIFENQKGQKYIFRKEKEDKEDKNNDSDDNGNDDNGNDDNGNNSNKNNDKNNDSGNNKNNDKNNDSDDSNKNNNSGNNGDNHKNNQNDKNNDSDKQSDKNKNIGEIANIIYKDNIRKKIKGESDIKIIDFLKKMIDIKVDWKKILDSITKSILIKSDELSWSTPRISSFSLGVYLPGYDKINSYGSIIIAIDESGSIDNSDIQKAVNIIFQSKTYFQKLIVFKHDVNVHSIKEFEINNNDSIEKEIIEYGLKRQCSGGTSHIDVFEKILQYKKKENIDLVILITDGESDLDICYKKYNNKNLPKIICLLSYNSNNNISFKKIYIND